jgi:hypothetical protein
MKMVAAKFLQTKGLQANSCIDWGYALSSPLLLNAKAPCQSGSGLLSSSSSILRD